MAVQPGFFDLSDRYEATSAAGDPLERLLAVEDLELFQGPLVAAVRPPSQGRTPAARFSTGVPNPYRSGEGRLAVIG